MVASIDIAGRRIGPECPCFIIAEAGVNHNGDPQIAQKLIDVAVKAGADAVKFQTFKAERLVTPNAPKAEYQKRTTDVMESQLDMLRCLEISPDLHRHLKNYCMDNGILFMSSPFDQECADLLSEIDVAVFKIPSGEITNLPLLSHVANKGKPMIVSTGMSTLGEVETALQVIKGSGNPPVVLLQCVSNYPAEPAEVNLRAMQTMESAFGVPVGYSDHTVGIAVPLAAVSLGACVVEKHFTLDRNLPGPDHPASLEPDELATMVEGIRTVQAALGHGRKEPALSELATAVAARKSLVAARDIAVNSIVTDDLIAVRRPGTGLPPAMRCQLIGRTVRVAMPAGTLFSLEMLA